MDELRFIVFQDLNRSIALGFTLEGYSAQEIAGELQDECEGCKRYSIKELIPHVEAWQSTFTKGEEAADK